MSHVLVIANETAASTTLLDALRDKDPAECRFTVIAPVASLAVARVHARASPSSGANNADLVP